MKNLGDIIDECMDGYEPEYNDPDNPAVQERRNISKKIVEKIINR